MTIPVRNVPCFLCNRKRPQRESTRATVAGQINVWLCRRCSRDPEAGVAERRAADERKEAT
jgi:hypothetical protein